MECSNEKLTVFSDGSVKVEPHRNFLIECDELEKVIDVVAKDASGDLVKTGVKKPKGQVILELDSLISTLWYDEDNA